MTLSANSSFWLLLFVLTLDIFLFLLKSEVDEKAAEWGMGTLDFWNINLGLKNSLHNLYLPESRNFWRELLFLLHCSELEKWLDCYSSAQNLQKTVGDFSLKDSVDWPDSVSMDVRLRMETESCILRSSSLKKESWEDFSLSWSGPILVFLLALFISMTSTLSQSELFERREYFLNILLSTTEDHEREFVSMSSSDSQALTAFLSAPALSILLLGNAPLKCEHGNTARKSPASINQH